MIESSFVKETLPHGDVGMGMEDRNGYASAQKDNYQ